MGNIQPPLEWSVTHAPGANTQATISKAADVGGRHVVTSITGSITGTGASSLIHLELIDGASGGTAIWSMAFEIAAGDHEEIALSGLNIVGTKNTAMTLEFDAAGGAATFQSVALTRYTCKENYVGV
jgi:hypothetical protein